MKTRHRLLFTDARHMRSLDNNSVDLVVTSPPYPMIAMWDELFCRSSRAVRSALAAKNGERAFELMHKRLDGVWNECYRTLREGGIICINIGDATRTLGNQFGLYPNHARILQHLRKCGFTALPDILWRKPTNAPNKFMGSGVLPVGAYVTLEHEYILIARKGDRRVFPDEKEKKKRRESALFWEERNIWYSDVWTDLTGTGQGLGPSAARSRSAAYPFELAYRLINMFSLRNDTVLDPFLGTGTTLLAAMASQRHSLGFELDASLKQTIEKGCESIVDLANDYINARLDRHAQFVADREVKHRNRRYGFGVVSAQECDIVLNALIAISNVGKDGYEVRYAAKKRGVRAYGSCP